MTNGEKPTKISGKSWTIGGRYVDFRVRIADVVIIALELWILLIISGHLGG